MLFNRVIDNLKKNKETREKGGYVGIPYPFPRLAEIIPSIERGQSIGVLGGTGVGKSKATRFIFLYSVYAFYKKTGYKVKIFYFPLEDNKEKVYKNCICNYLNENYDIHISYNELNSKTTILPDFVLEKIEEANDYFADFEKIVEFVDGIYKPKGIYDFLEDYAKKTGKVKSRTRKTEEGLDIKETYYESDTHTLVILDNLSNLDEDPEDDINSEREAMTTLAKKYVRQRLCNFFGFTVVQIMQLDFQSERQQFTHSGMTIVSKLEPSLAGIGDAKTIARSMHLILGLFDPSRFDLIQYPIPSRQDPENCYRIDILGDKFRALKVLKDNDGASGIRIGLRFNPLQETLEELPRPKTPEIKAIYEKLTKEQGRNFGNPKEITTFDETEELF